MKSVYSELGTAQNTTEFWCCDIEEIPFSETSGIKINVG